MPGYCVAYSDVHDAEAYGKYSSQAPAVIKQHGGRIRVRGGRHEVLEGPPVADRIIMLQFDSVEAGQAWYDSSEYQEISKIRYDAADLIATVVDGQDLGDDVPDAAGYMIVKAKVSNWDAMKEYGPLAGALLPQFGGKLISNGPFIALEGAEIYNLMVLLQFPSLDQALAYYRSPEYQALIPIREGAAEAQFVAVEGA